MKGHTRILRTTLHERDQLIRHLKMHITNLETLLDRDQRRCAEQAQVILGLEAELAPHRDTEEKLKQSRAREREMSGRLAAIRRMLSQEWKPDDPPARDHTIVFGGQGSSTNPDVWSDARRAPPATHYRDLA